jgi:hypothetical protein
MGSSCLIFVSVVAVVSLNAFTTVLRIYPVPVVSVTGLVLVVVVVAVDDLVVPLISRILKS